MAESQGSGGIGDVLGGYGLQAVGDFGGMYAQFGANQILASKAWDRWKNAQTRGPTYSMIGLEKAGLNPALAAGGQLPTYSPKSPQAAISGKGGGGNPNVISQARLIDSQTKLNDASRLAQLALEQKYKADTRLTDTNENLARLDTAKKEVLANYFNTAAGMNMLRMGQETAASPKSMAEFLQRFMTRLQTDPELQRQVRTMLESAPPSVRSIMLNLIFGGD